MLVRAAAALPATFRRSRRSAKSAFDTRNPRTFGVLVSTLFVLVMTSGCGPTRRGQLHRVAKDWAETIRASQVIPVYPMTEDLQPGDVYLVQTPISTQQEIWKKAGYLPLDNHFYRLHPEGYEYFYEKSFLDGDVTTVLPKEWRNSSHAAWSTAPGAAFPAYGFTVRQGKGLNIAAPISGVPVGLSLLDTTTATASVVIKDARTLGVDIASLYKQLQEWALESSDLLAAYGATDDGVVRNYLRVVCRVYLTGQIDVSIQDARSGSMGLDVGASRPVDLLFANMTQDTPATSLEQYQKNLKTLNSMLEAEKATRLINGVEMLVPGGSFKVVAASARSVSLAETFDPPIVLGYLGFDVEIRNGGEIGPPVPTYALLSGDSNAAITIGAVYRGPLLEFIELFDAAAARPDSDAVFGAAAEALGPDWRSLYDRLRRANPSFEPSDAFDDLRLAYRSVTGATSESRQSAINHALETALLRSPNHN